MKNRSTLIVLLLNVFISFSQNKMPKSLVTVNSDNTYDLNWNSLLSNYDSIKNTNDSNSVSLRKNADRWLYFNQPRLSINNDDDYNYSDYYKSLKSFVASSIL